jgi:hypothetical protein
VSRSPADDDELEGGAAVVAHHEEKNENVAHVVSADPQIAALSGA